MAEKSTSQAAIQNTQALTITWYQVWSGIHINNPSLPVPEFGSYRRILLAGTANPPYTITQISIRFVADGSSLDKPYYQEPYVYCDMHLQDYPVIMDLITRGVDNKKPGTTFQAQFIIDIAQLDMYIST